MKIVVCVRTRDNEKEIERFCHCYNWADKILIADGGSEDRTKELASQFYNVEIRDFPVRVSYGNQWRNPFGKHFNFLMGWAKEEDPTWIVFDDSDCVPNVFLRVQARDLFDDGESISSYPDAMFANRVYIKGENQYYSEMNIPGVSLWAWRGSVNIYADEQEENKLYNIPERAYRFSITPPCALLHYFYPDEETIQKKLRLYEATKELGGVPQHPDAHMGHLEPVKGWMRWK